MHCINATVPGHISLEFSSRWYLCARRSPYALHPVSQRFLQRCLWNDSSVSLIDDDPLSSFQGRSSCASSFHASPPDDRWCDALGFVPAGSVSSFSILQIFGEASHLWGLLCSPVYLLGHFPSLQHVQGSTPAGVFEWERRPSTHFSLGFPFHYSLFVATSWNLWGWRHVRSDCHFLRQSSGRHGWLGDTGDISVKKLIAWLFQMLDTKTTKQPTKGRCAVHPIFHCSTFV